MKLTLKLPYEKVWDSSFVILENMMYLYVFLREIYLNLTQENTEVSV